MIRGRKLGFLSAGVALGALWTAVEAPPALAACHAFTVTAKPSSVTEGAAVTVTVSRDAAVAPSNVDVETIDETAQAGLDYRGVARRTVSFSNDTAQSFDVPTVDNTEPEQAETFRLHLSNPGGCAVNPNYVVGPDVTVTILDNDEAGTTAPPTTGAPATTSKPANAGTVPTTTTTVTSTTESSTTSSSTSASTDTAPVAGGESALPDGEDTGSGGSAWAIVAGLAAVAALGAAGAVLWRRRTQSRQT